MTNAETELISLRIPKSLSKQLSEVCVQEDSDRSTLIREVLLKGLAEKRLDFALEEYKRGKVTLWRAAKLARVSLWRMTDMLKERRIDLQYSEEDLKKDLTLAKAIK